jgi:GH24 family phage-related lysozyme (muramidase)
MRHLTGAGLALIQRFESFSPTVYICPAGYPSVGYGHVVLDGESDRFAGGINEDEAEDLLRHDSGIAECAVLRLITVPLTDGQFDALVSFVFNVGAGGLQRSTLRRKVNLEEHSAVPAEFIKWVWAGGRKLKGLVRRREAEARMYQTDNHLP